MRNPSLQRIGEAGLSAVQSEAKIALILRDILVNTLNNIPKRLTSAFSKRLSLRIRTELDMTQPNYVHALVGLCQAVRRHLFIRAGSHHTSLRR